MKLKNINRNWLYGLYGILAVFFLLVFFQNSLFYIADIEVEGNHYVKSDYFIKTAQKYKGNLFSIDKKILLMDLYQNPFVNKIFLVKKLLHTLVIKVEEKDLVGKISLGNKEAMYLDEEGNFLPSNSYQTTEKVPLFKVKEKAKNPRVTFISKVLAVLKMSDEKFFSKISKIDLLNDDKTFIFMISNQKKYEVEKNPDLEAFLKIRFLESQNIHGRQINIKGNSVSIKH